MRTARRFASVLAPCLILIPILPTRADVTVVDATISGSVSTHTFEAFGSAEAFSSDAFVYPADTFATCGTAQIAHCADAGTSFSSAGDALSLTLSGFTTTFEHSAYHADSHSSTSAVVHFSLSAPVTATIVYTSSGGANGGFSIAGPSGFSASYYPMQFPTPNPLVAMPAGDYTLSGTTNLISDGNQIGEWDFTNTLDITGLPEPASLALFVAALPALAMRRRRR